MAVGSIPTRILTDIGNAIRYQAGVATTYTPGQLAAAVAALDGSDAGDYSSQGYITPAAGYISDSVFGDIADAIRAQNGSSDTYTPEDMAQAILDLSWAPPRVFRAHFLDNNCLEFNYLPSIETVQPGRTIVQTFDNLSTTGYSAYYSTNRVPWVAGSNVYNSVTSVYIDSSLALLCGASTNPMTNISGLFSFLHHCDSFTGLQYLAGVSTLTDLFYYCGSITTLDLTDFPWPFLQGLYTSATYMFRECYALQTIYVTPDFNSLRPNYLSASNAFSSCRKLVGGNGTAFNSSYIDNSRFWVDSVDHPGYFTAGPAPSN